MALDAPRVGFASGVTGSSALCEAQRLFVGRVAGSEGVHKSGGRRGLRGLFSLQLFHPPRILITEPRIERAPAAVERINYDAVRPRMTARFEYWS